MKTSYATICRTALCGAALFIPSISYGDDKPAPDHVAKVQIALLLDTSNSMDGLIAQAKTQLWRICNTFIEAKVDGQQPILEVSLYEYGNMNIDAGSHWVRQIEPLTRDLDEVSRELFALRTNGGEEFCGAVIQRSITDLQWDESPHTYKVIFIAGNEPFTQGPINVMSSCKNAKDKQVIVNSIYCGDKQAAISERWHDGPALADGVFLSIDANQVVAQVDAPQDKEIARLNELLNKTYLHYGTHGAEMKQRQVACDEQALAHAQSGASVERSVTKASANYCNVAWDVVDAVQQNKLQLDKVDKAQLPKEMQEMTQAQRTEHVAKLAAERKVIQAQILELASQREAFLLEKQKQQAGTAVMTLDQAAIKAVREQAAKKGFQFGK